MQPLLQLILHQTSFLHTPAALEEKQGRTVIHANHLYEEHKLYTLKKKYQCLFARSWEANAMLIKVQTFCRCSMISQSKQLLKMAVATFNLTLKSTMHLISTEDEMVSYSIMAINILDGSREISGNCLRGRLAHLITLWPRIYESLTLHQKYLPLSLSLFFFCIANYIIQYP